MSWDENTAEWLNDPANAEIVDSRISERERRDREQMLRSGDAFVNALGLRWPGCDHHRNPETTHRVGNAVMCRVCRRKRWQKGFKVALAQRALSAHLASKAPLPEWYRPTAFFVDELIAGVAEDFGMSATLLKSPKRTRVYVHARAVVFKILHERGWSYPRMARAVGRKDHSTAIHSVDNFDVYCKMDPRVSASFLKHMRACDAM